MFGLPFSAVVNLAQTIGALGGAWLVQRGYASGDQVQQIFGGLGAAILLVFNAVNHASALAAVPPSAVPSRGADATA